MELPDTVIRRAYELLDTETRQMGELIRDLEDQKLIVDQKNEELQRREYEMLEMMAEMKKQQQKGIIQETKIYFSSHCQLQMFYLSM